MTAKRNGKLMIYSLSSKDVWTVLPIVDPQESRYIYNDVAFLEASTKDQRIILWKNSE